MISKISQNLTACLDKATHFSMKGVALAGSALSFQQLMFTVIAANDYLKTGIDDTDPRLRPTEIHPLTQYTIAGSAFALASVALGRFAFLSKIHF